MIDPRGTWYPASSHAITGTPAATADAIPALESSIATQSSRATRERWSANA